MLLISIKTLQDDRFLRPLQNISGLFFEDSTIGFEQEEANLIVDIHIEENVKASARLTDVYKLNGVNIKIFIPKSNSNIFTNVIITILTSAKYKLCLNFNSFCINPKLIKNNTIVLFNSGYLVTVTTIASKIMNTVLKAINILTDNLLYRINCMYKNV